MERVRFKSNGQYIEGTLVTPQNSRNKQPAVIFLHGMTSSEKNYIPIAERLAQQGLVGLTINIRGHGTSEGDFNKLTLYDGVKDGIAAYDFLTSHSFVDPDRIGMCGASVGAALAALVSETRPIQSLALRVPATYTTEMMGMTYQQIMAEEKEVFNTMTEISSTPALQAIAKFTGSLLVVISGKDAIIPRAIPEQYLLDARSARKKEEFIMEDATHQLSDTRWRQEFTDEAVQWFTKTLKDL